MIFILKAFFIGLISIMVFVNQSNASLVEPNIKWRKTSINICWGDYSDRIKVLNPLEFNKKKDIERVFNNVEKNILEKSISQEFTAKSTIIRFNFDSQKKCDAYVFGFILKKGSNPKAHSTIGEKSIDSFKRRRLSFRKPRVYISFPLSFLSINGGEINLSKKEFIKNTAIHEFGHLAGLRHEHAQKTEELDAFCNHASIIFKEKSNPTTLAYTSFDTLSVMNYCLTRAIIYHYGAVVALDDIYGELSWKIRDFLKNEDVFETKSFIASKKSKTIRFKLGLSEGDIYGLKCLYSDQEDCVKINPYSLLKQ